MGSVVRLFGYLTVADLGGAEEAKAPPSHVTFGNLRKYKNLTIHEKFSNVKTRLLIIGIQENIFAILYLKNFPIYGRSEKMDAKDCDHRNLFKFL